LIGYRHRRYYCGTALPDRNWAAAPPTR
jgi:hypothetical protein